MAITSEIIGKLGGAGVEVIPVEGAVSGGRGSSTVIATIDIPAGETWLVAAIGQVSAGSSSYPPRLQIGDEVSTEAPRGTHGLAMTATEPISFSIRQNASIGADSFTGHVYTVKL